MMYLDLVHSFPPCKLLQSPFDLYLVDTLHGRRTQKKLPSLNMQGQALISWQCVDCLCSSCTPCSPHLHLQHLVENGLGQAFSNVSLVGSLHQLVSVLLLWNDTATPGDLMTTTVSAGFSLLRFLRVVFKLRLPTADTLCGNITQKLSFGFTMSNFANFNVKEQF